MLGSNHLSQPSIEMNTIWEPLRKKGRLKAKKSIIGSVEVADK